MRLLCSAALLVLIAGCDDSPASPPTIDGSYPLRTYRDLPLPAVVSEDASHSVQITAGTITLNGDLTFTDSYTVDKYDNGVRTTVVVACTGYWRVTGTSPQDGVLISLYEASLPPGCGDHGAGEWDRNKRLTVSWDVLGSTQHRR
jgi:hypothetical protein